MNSENSGSRRRRSIRYEAARIMAEDGIRDYQRAKEKACLRLGVSHARELPTNLEIENSLRDQLRIFSYEPLQVKRRRYIEAACSVMQSIEKYFSRLTGAALSGTITSSRPVELHVFTSTVEEFCALLDELCVRYQQFDKRMRFARHGFVTIPGVEFSQFDIGFECYLFVPGDPYPPLSPTTGKPVKGASRKKVERMLESLRESL